MALRAAGAPRSSATYVAQAGIIAAVYATATLLCMITMQGLAWGPIQLRLSEALCVLALFSAPAVPGLFVGCILANLANTAISGLGLLGMLDVIFGGIATLLGALWCRTFANRPVLAVSGFVLFNALIVPAYLPILLQGLGFYTIPFTNTSLDGMYPLMYAFGFIAIGIGEAVVVYGLGLPLFHGMLKAGISIEPAKRLSATNARQAVHMGYNEDD